MIVLRKAAGPQNRYPGPIDILCRQTNTASMAGASSKLWVYLMAILELSGVTPGDDHDQSKTSHNRRWAGTQIWLCMTRWVEAPRHAAHS